MDIWKRDVATSEPSASQPPPGFKPRVPLLRPAQALELRLIVPTVLGSVFAMIVLFTAGVSAVTGPAIFVPPLLGGGAALAAKRRGPEVIGWTLMATFAAFATVMVIAPILIFFDFLDCWFSWLSDC